MSLNIKVNHVRKSKVFHGGDQISGVVEARGPIKEDATVVQIKFKGKSQTLIKRSNGQSTSRWKDKVKFFRVIKVLFRGPCHLDSGSSTSWPFTFELPLLTEPPHGNPDITYSKATDKPYAKAAHPLPPTFSLSGSKYKALITYSLRADLQRNGFLSTSLHKSGSLPVTQSRPRANAANEPPDPQPTTLRQTFTLATSRLLPSHASRARSLREWASDTFTSKAPTAHFVLAAEAPKTLVPARPIPIYLRLGYDAEKSTAPTVPEFRLSRAEFVVKEHTHVRGRAMLSWDVHEKPSKVVLRSLWVFDTPRMGSGVLVSGEAVEVGAAAAAAGEVLRLGEGVGPSFASYSVCRTYTASLTVHVSCVEKEFEAKFKWAPVVVLPAEVEEDEGEKEGEGGMEGLGKAAGIAILDLEDAAEIGGQIVEGVANVLGLLN